MYITHTTCGFSACSSCGGCWCPWRYCCWSAGLERWAMKSDGLVLITFKTVDGKVVISPILGWWSSWATAEVDEMRRKRRERRRRERAACVEYCVVVVVIAEEEDPLAAIVGVYIYVSDLLWSIDRQINQGRRDRGGSHWMCIYI